MPDPTALLTIDGSRSGYGGKPVVQASISRCAIAE
jgi:hypothetical protein